MNIGYQKINDSDQENENEMLEPVFLDCGQFTIYTLEYLKHLSYDTSEWEDMMICITSYDTIDHREMCNIDNQCKYEPRVLFYDTKQFVLKHKGYYIGFVPETYINNNRNRQFLSVSRRDQVKNNIYITKDWTEFAILLWKHTRKTLPWGNIRPWLEHPRRTFEYGLYTFDQSESRNPISAPCHCIGLIDKVSWDIGDDCVQVDSLPNKFKKLPPEPKLKYVRKCKVNKLNII